MLPVILGAGLGTRLGGQPKALYELAGATLLDRCAAALEAAGFTELVVVTGHGAEEVESAWRASPRALEASLLHNPLYAELNNFHTLALACEQCPPGPLLVLNSDIVFLPRVIEDTSAAGGDLGLAVEPGVTDEEALKVLVEDGAPRALGKGLPADRSYGEFIGVSLLSPAGRTAYAEAAEAARAADERDLYYEDVFSRICGSVDSRLTDVAAGDWAEIDAPEDVPAALEVARRQAASA